MHICYDQGTHACLMDVHLPLPRLPSAMDDSIPPVAMATTPTTPQPKPPCRACMTHEPHDACLDGVAASQIILCRRMQRTRPVDDPHRQLGRPSSISWGWRWQSLQLMQTCAMLVCTIDVVVRGQFSTTHCFVYVVHGRVGSSNETICRCRYYTHHRPAMTGVQHCSSTEGRQAFRHERPFS
jgi:hypothetical protein